MTSAIPRLRWAGAARLAATKVGAVMLVAAIAGLGTFRGAAAADVPTPNAPASARIVVKNFTFSPVPLTVHVGTTVTWVNKYEEPHTAVSDTGVFRSGAMDTNESFSFTFVAPGTYRFACSIHPSMVGIIIVE